MATGDNFVVVKYYVKNSFHTLASIVVFSNAFPKSSNALLVSVLVSGMRMTFVWQFYHKHRVQN